MKFSRLALFLLTSCVVAQPLAQRSFEVASIKKASTCRGVQRRISPGGFDFGCISIRELLVLSYGSLQGDPLHVGTIRVLGGPSWLDDERYDVSTKAEGRASLREMVGPMLIALLQDRLGLKAHIEPVVTPVYALRLVDGPNKLRPTEEGSCKPIDLEDLPKAGDPGHYCGLEHHHVDGGTIISEWYGVTMAELASRGLTIYAGNYVVDQTGLGGRFDIHLEFRRSTPLTVNGVEVSSGEPESGAPTLFTALHAYGLKLVPAKAPIDVVMVDKIQRPSEN